MQIERKIKITYRWWNDEENEIDSNHLIALEETAQERIFEMIRKGYTSGELHDNIRMHATDPENGIDYQGHFELSYT